MKHSFSGLLFSSVTAGILLCGVVANAQQPSMAANDKPLTRSEVEDLVKKVINENPELILNSVETYQKKKMTEDASKASKGIASSQAELKNDPGSPSIGNPNGDVTIIEFFDYHCGYCKQFLPVVTKLIDEDKKLRVVFKEFPILSEDSDLAAKAALAVNSIDKGKYLAYHTALMKMSTSFTMENLTAAAKEVGIDENAFKKALENPEVEKQISKNRDLAYSLSIHGTPAVIIGTELIPGVMPASALKTKIAAARGSNKKE